MAIIKCKMCGGDLNILPDSTVCECEYCGSKQTIPNTDDEKRLKLYERANKLRFDCEFDKASGVYESIVSEFQSEAEAYWGLVLCKYGIEYVDDPKTGKKIPTCHRSSFDSIFDDSNFDLVMENSDTISRGVYREEAKQIEELRKGIIEVSSKEDAYDIFICYKETADDGQRTIDSVIAQDVYEALTERGYRVFFSRITLEDKLGQEYEPYIFAALNSAKVMLAFGTTYDYYNAVWVKNEWSRFLQLMELGQKKTLIPCFKDIDAYDMPKEFARLQAQDMGKVGAIQDLVRGIDKIFGNQKNIINSEALTKGDLGNKEAIVKRGYLALEDGEWKNAIKFFDQALNSDAENAEVYIGLFLAKKNYSNLDTFLNSEIESFIKVEPVELNACQPQRERINKFINDNVIPGLLDRREIENSLKFDLTYKSIVNELFEKKYIFDDKDWEKAERFSTGTLNDRLSQIKQTYLQQLDKMIEDESNNDKAKVKQISENYDKFIDLKMQEIQEKKEQRISERKVKHELEENRRYDELCKKIDICNSKKELQDIINE
ncbi:MAG: toll/interleukin-1 receptor domain-containing protein, partial [Eubacterium sp.]|nr:toll/interleukin-1 receptor domain-containing protein [Eubacterium sp.]